MLTWLAADIALAQQTAGINWLIAMWHHPSYAGTVSDTDPNMSAMRQVSE